MKRVLFFLIFISLLLCVKAEVNIEVKNMRCEPNPVMSGEMFHLYATVVNLGDKAIDTDIILWERTAPDGFWGFDAEVNTIRISLPAYGEEELDYTDIFVCEDERFELFFITSDGERISDYCPLQVGECGNEITHIELYPDNISMNVGMANSLLAWVYPGSAPQQVIWEIENPDVIKITEYYERGDQGVIFEATAAGETDITVTAGNGISASCHIVVFDPVKAETITLNTNEIVGEVGDIFQLEAYTMPEDNDAIVVYNSSNEKVATVGLEDGLVTITGTGTTEIYAWATPSVGFVQATCTITGKTSGINDITTDVSDKVCDIYTPGGTLIVRGVTREQINELSKGFYILRYPHKTEKLIR